MSTRWAWCAALAGLLIGCHEPPEIKHYQVVHLSREERMLAALIPAANGAWFFKLQGDPEAIDKLKPEFKKLVESVSTSDTQKPVTWKTPKGWTQESGGGEIRLATLKIPETEPPLEVAITVLPAPGGVTDAYIAQNLDRWRGQLQLDPLGEKWSSDDSVTRIPFDGGEAIAVDLLGTPKAGGMSPPFAGMGDGPPRASAGPPPTADDLISEKDVPAGWKQGRLTALRRAAYEVQDGKQKVEITVIALGGDGHSVPANVSRWRGQVGLPELPLDEIKTEKVPVGKIEGDFVALDGKNAETQQPETILGVMAQVGELSWFIKLQGDTALAAREKESFLKFVSAIQLPGTGGETDGN